MKEGKLKEQFIELRASGLSYQKIALQLSISKQTAIKWAQELSTTIYNLKALEMEALHEKHFLTVQARVEFFSEQMQKIKIELSKRAFTDIPTEKLFELMGKLTPFLVDPKPGITLKKDVSFLENALSEANVVFCDVP